MKKFSHLILFMCMVLIIVFTFCVSAFAVDVIASADFNDGSMHWEISADNVLTISGTGTMPNYSSSNSSPWYSYRSQINSIVVGNGITAIGDYGFYQLSNVSTVSLPNTLSALGKYCFAECSKLKSISVPAGVSFIPESCFDSCSSIEEINLPDTVNSFGSSAFYRCSSLKAIDIPEGTTHLTSYCLFYGCSSLKQITIPKSLMFMGNQGRYTYDRCFYGTKITDIFYNGSVADWMSIYMLNYDSDSLAMRQNYNLYIQGERLTNIIIPDGITTIPEYSFQYINASSLMIPAGVQAIGEQAFYGSSISSVRMPDSITNVNTNAFANCSSLKKLYFIGDRSKWTNIAWNSGNDCIIDCQRSFVDSLDRIRSVTVGETVHGTVSVSDNCCIAGDEITIMAQPDLGYKLSSIRVNGVEISGNRFVTEADTDYVVTAEFEFYMNVKDHGTCGANLEWYLFDNNELVINGTGKMLNYNSSSRPWYNYRGIVEKITLSDGITYIGNYAFAQFSKIEELTIPDTVEEIGNYSFRDCNNLSVVSFSKSITNFGSDAFRNCKLKEVYYGGDISDWLRITFYDFGGPQGYTEKLYFNNTLVQNVEIPAGVTVINGYSFANYLGLQSLKLSEGVKSIGMEAFSGTSLDHVIIPQTVEMIEAYAFYGDLIYAEFLGDAPAMASEVFGSTDNVNGTVIYYHAGTVGWSSPKWSGYYAACVEATADYGVLDDANRNAQGVLFTLNNTSKTATVGDGSTNYNNAGYYGAQKGAVVVPDTVVKNGIIYRVIGINQYAFSQNKHITSISIGSGVTSIIPSAFTACPNLEVISVSSENEFYSSVDGVLYDAEGLYLYSYPGGKTNLSFTVPSSVKTIGQNAFYDNEYLQTLYVGTNVTAIYQSAFCGLTNLEEITLPFVGKHSETEDGYSTYSFLAVFDDGYFGSNPVGRVRKWNGSEYEYTYGNLAKVTILGGELLGYAFENCYTIREITLPKTPESIPVGCFYYCERLEAINFADTGFTCSIGDLVLPEGIKEIQSSAFFGCLAVKTVSLPATLTYMDNGAFSNSGLESFTVAKGNRSYSTDSWGVLYSYDKKTLVQYPSCRPWPYYNVAEGTASIQNRAFVGCENLVNVYIPNSVTSLNNSFQSCPNTTICCFINSAAYRYALNSNLTAWYMDNKTLQGIRIYSLPEQEVQLLGKMNLQGLYVVGNYQGRELQIDDYTLSYDTSSSGVKTVTVEYQGMTVTFEMMLFVNDSGNIISFSCTEDSLDGKVVYIAIYSDKGAMIYAGTAIIMNGTAQICVSDTVYQQADIARLFILDESTFAPAAESMEQTIA